jgi:hypothetical protein
MGCRFGFGKRRGRWPSRPFFPIGRAKEYRVTKIDLNQVWDDAKAMGLASKDLLSAMAGMFLLLPTVVALQFITAPEPMKQGTPGPQMLRQYVDHYLANWHIMFSQQLIFSFGSLAMLVLLLRRERLTVGESLRAALVLLPGYFIADLVEGLALALGLFLFVVPGLYLIARFSLIATVAAAEEERNPITLLRRSIELTRGNGWRIFLMLAIIFITGQIVTQVITLVIGLGAALLLPGELAELLMNVIAGLVLAVVGVITVLVNAAIYRAVTAPAPVAWQP